jgi:hypothetical protein
MNRRTIIAALTAVGAASLAVAPAYAQQESALDVKIGTETAATRAGALPMPALKLGNKGTASVDTTQPLAPSSNARKLTIAPSVDVPIVNK